ncbi:LPXTG cell wall anchor domain-containing protein, partial [Gemella sp.]
ADHYKVRISLADQNRTGMSYQAWDEKYSVPVTGLDFSIAQDTSNVARNLLQRIYDKLKATESADKNGKTAQTIQDYEAELEKVKSLLADPAARTANFKQALEDLLAKQLGLKTDKTGLTNSKAELDALVNEDPTPGKTQDTAAAYNAAKQEAVKAIESAKTVIDNGNATVAEVREALAKVNDKKTSLEAAKQALIEAATAEEKAKLKADSDSLVKADTTGKTPNSIEAYNTKYEALKEQLDTAKTEAATVLAKENNASKAEVQAAQAKVDAVKAELTKAEELLVNKADKTELTKAKEALSTLVSEADPTTGKTEDSAKTYNDAKTAATEAIKAAETVINDENATQDQVTEALNRVNEKKVALEAAKQALVEAATAEEKAKLKADAALLTKADETGKTPDSIKTYEAEYEKLKAQLEEAKAATVAVEAKGDNATKVEVQEAQVKVDAAKKALEKAAELLKDLVDKTKLTTVATTEAEETKGSPAYYNADEAKKEAYDKALAEAKKVLENDKATQAEVNAALKALEEAKAALNGQPTNKDALTKAATTDAEETKGSPAYYNADEAKKAEYDKALAEAKKVLENDKATQAEVNAALKALEEAKAALNGQPTNKDALTKAATTDAEATKGSPEYYNADEAKKAAYDKALAEAKKVLENDKATQAEVNAALKALEEARAVLNGQPTNKDALTKAATTEAEETKGSPAYYNADEAKKAAYDKALAEAKKVLENDKATQVEVNAALKALEEAKAALNGQPTNKDALTKAATIEAEEIKGSPVYYNADEAKKAAYDKALAEAKKVLENDKATQAEVNAALKALEEAKAGLNGYVSHKINPAISEVEEFDITELIVKGIVEVEKGQTLNENDIKSKLNLPDGIEIVEIEYPDTNTLGRKVVKVILRGNDGNLFTVEVPVEVVGGKGFNNITIGNDNSANKGSKDKVDSKMNQKLLPNTGTAETNTGLAGLGLAVLGGLLAVARRRREKNEN